MLDLRISNRKYTENCTSCKRFQISKLVEIQRFHKISGNLYEISSELRTPRLVHSRVGNGFYIKVITVKKLVSPGHQIWCPRFVPIRTPKLVSPVHFNK